MSMSVIRRTFEAAQHPKDSEERARLNCDVKTSEYNTGSRYMVRKDYYMTTGERHPQQYLDFDFRTKKAAEDYIKSCGETPISEYEQQLIRAREILKAIPDNDLRFMLDLVGIKVHPEQWARIDQFLIAMQINTGLSAV